MHPKKRKREEGLPAAALSVRDLSTRGDARLSDTGNWLCRGLVVLGVALCLEVLVLALLVVRVGAAAEEAAGGAEGKKLNDGHSNGDATNHAHAVGKDSDKVVLEGILGGARALGDELKDELAALVALGVSGGVHAALVVHLLRKVRHLAVELVHVLVGRAAPKVAQTVGECKQDAHSHNLHDQNRQQDENVQNQKQLAAAALVVRGTAQANDAHHQQNHAATQCYVLKKEAKKKDKEHQSVRRTSEITNVNM